MSEPASSTNVVLVDPWVPVRTHVVGEVAKRLQAMGIDALPADILKDLAQPPEGMGDLAVPLFRYAKSARASPQDLGARLSQGFPLGEMLRGVAPAGGFVNFSVDFPWFARMTLLSVATRGEDYGRHPEPRGTICVEHTSANPTGQLHVGRSRNSLIGDTYARVLKAAGFKVRVQFYVDDIGRQAATLIWIWAKPVGSWPADIRERSGVGSDGSRPEGMKPDEWRGKPYATASSYIKEHEEGLKEVTRLIERFEGGEIRGEDYRTVPQEILEGVLATLRRVGVEFDEFVWESDFIRDGSVKGVLERLAVAPHAERGADGALSLDLTSYGLPEEITKMYVTRSDGSSLYVARDLAYHEKKLKEFDRVIDVLGEDHRNHFRALTALLEELRSPRKPEVLFYSFVGLPAEKTSEGPGRSVKMSTRQGRSVTLDALLNEARDRARTEVVARRPETPADEVEAIAESVGTAAVRFHLLAIQPDKPIVFHWEEALSFEGKSGPFVQYSYARASSLVRKAEEAGEKRYLTGFKGGTLDMVAIPGEADAREVALLKALSRFPSLISRVSTTGSVHLLALYAHEVAERFNEFYQTVRVLGGDDAWIPFRLSLVHATRQVLGNVSRIIGVEPLEKM